jgi:hypothetical protein
LPVVANDGRNDEKEKETQRGRHEQDSPKRGKVAKILPAIAGTPTIEDSTGSGATAQLSRMT